ncbi:MAG: hypothetical protein Q4C63_08460 [Eubacteriales bacterium]|nr:hypothetical protein [Eubacteriales bacterium]
MERIMAILDGEKNYAQRLCDYANRRNCLPFRAVAFSDVASYKSFAKEHRVRLLLADTGLIEGEYDLSADCVLGLSDSEGGRNGGNGLVSVDREVYKYQPGEVLFRTVMSCVGEFGEELRLCSPERKAKLICVYSPVSRCGKTSFALAYALSRARRQKVLYLNFEAFSGLSALLGERFQSGLSDALYHLKQGSLDGARIASLIHHCRELDFIPPFATEEDLLTMSGEDCAGLIEVLLRETDHEVVVADTGAFFPAAVLMEASDLIYMPVREDPMSKGKLDAFEAYLRENGKEQILSRLHRLRLPFAGSAQDIFPESLLLGPLGDYARELAG